MKSSAIEHESYYKRFMGGKLNEIERGENYIDNTLLKFYIVT